VAESVSYKGSSATGQRPTNQGIKQMTFSFEEHTALVSLYVSRARKETIPHMRRHYLDEAHSHKVAASNIQFWARMK